MKKRIIISFLGLVIMAILPFISVGKIFPENEIPQSSMQKKIIDTNKFLVLDTSSNKIISIDDREFCIGAVAFEMPASFEEEALKAQCIACYTHFSRLRENSTEAYDFSADLSNGEFYTKDISNESRQKISSAVDAVFGQVLTDSDGNTIGEGIPLHISRFFPRFHMTDRDATKVSLVYRLANVARERLKHVYTGNC